MIRIGLLILAPRLSLSIAKTASLQEKAPTRHVTGEPDSVLPEKIKARSGTIRPDWVGLVRRRVRRSSSEGGSLGGGGLSNLWPRLLSVVFSSNTWDHL